MKDDKGQKIHDYIINNSEYLSLLCKSIGQIEAEIQDTKVEQQGREYKTGGKYIVKSPITLQFYDTVVENGLMLSDVFKMWVQRWNLISNDNKVLFTRRMYMDNNAFNMKIKVYPGGYWEPSRGSRKLLDVINRSSDIKDKNKSTINEVDKVQRNQTTSDMKNFDRFNRGIGAFWDSPKINDSTGEMAFIQALRGIGGSGVTFHGIINSIVFGLYKTLTFAEAFGKFVEGAKDIDFQDPETWVEVFLGVQPSPSNNSSFKRTYDDGNPKYMDEVLSSRKLDSGMISSLNQFRDSGIVKNLITTAEIAINSNQFADDKQLQTSLKILKSLLNTDPSSMTVSKLAEIAEVNDFIVAEEFEIIKKILTDVIEGSAESLNFINDSELSNLKRLLDNLNLQIEIFKGNFPLSEEQQASIKKILNEIDDAIAGKELFISRIEYENYLKNIKPKFKTNHFLDSRDLLKKIFTPLTMIPRAIMIMHNAKSLYNLVGARNGWDDFINANQLGEFAQSETIVLGSMRVLKMALSDKSWLDVDGDLTGSNIKKYPGENKDGKQVDDYVFTNRKSQTDSFTNNQEAEWVADIETPEEWSTHLTQPLKEINLSYVYPSSVVLLPNLGHDKTGESSLPTFDVHFNFFDIVEN